MAGDKENPVPPEGQGEGAPPVEGATKMFSMKLDSWLSDFSPGDLLGEGAPGAEGAPAAAPVVEPLDIAPVEAPKVVIAAVPQRISVPGLIPPPEIAPLGRSSSADLLASPLADPLARISRPDLLAAQGAPLIDPLAAPTIDPLALPVVVSPAPPPGVSAAAMMIGLPREMPEPPRGRGVLIALLVILVLVAGAAVAVFVFGDKLPFLNFLHGG